MEFLIGFMLGVAAGLLLFLLVVFLSGEIRVEPAADCPEDHEGLDGCYCGFRR